MRVTPLISIIIPVYNTDKYLERCLSSVTNQTYQNIEIIIVDDGSTDKSPTIIKKYVKKDPRVKVINQENSGQGSARNRGIDSANGEYIMFVDSDDYVCKNFCQAAYESVWMNHTEIAIFDINVGTRVPYTRLTFNKLNCGCITKEEALSTTINASFSVNKIYKSTLFKNIRYPLNILYEDIFTTYKLINTANSISYIKKPLYYYVQRDNSTVHHFTAQSMTSYFEANQELFEFFKLNYPKLASKMIDSVLQGSFYFLAYVDNTDNSLLIDQAEDNLKSLPLQKTMEVKWIIMTRLYRCFPKLTLRLFKKKVLHKNY